jgi:hypothetical protein
MVVGHTPYRSGFRLASQHEIYMRSTSLYLTLFSLLLLAGCGGGVNSYNTAATGNANSAAPEKQTLTTVDRPQKIKDQMAARGEQDQAAPSLSIAEPKAGSTVSSSTVKVKLNISGDLKGYMPHMDEATKTGNHVHIILDNQPYEAYYNLDHEFELRNVIDGDHTIRVFPSRPWHESYKNENAFAMVKFTVKNGGGDAAKPTTTANGNTMANANSARPTPEGKDMGRSNAQDVDPKKPLLTYSRPKGEYKGDDANAIMIDFWLVNAKLKGDGGEFRVRYTVDKDEPKFIDKWEPIWLTGWTSGKHTILLELIGADGQPVDNGGYNTTVREITVTK